MLFYSFILSSGWYDSFLYTWVYEQLVKPHQPLYNTYYVILRVLDFQVNDQYAGMANGQYRNWVFLSQLSYLFYMYLYLVHFRNIVEISNLVVIKIRYKNCSLIFFFWFLFQVIFT